MRVSLIVAAGGSGERFRRSLHGKRRAPSHPSKLFFELGGIPVLVRALSAFQDIAEIQERIVVVPRDARAQVSKLFKAHGLQHIQIISGGKTRAESVRKGLKKAKRSSDWVMVHDGARPLLTAEAVRKLLFACTRTGVDGAVLAEPAVSTMKEVDAGSLTVTRTVDRRMLYAAQTPQLVKRALLERAYRKGSEALAATDESALIESVNGNVKLVLHEAWNPKITTPQDLQIAEAYLKGSSANETIDFRVGLGQDFHPLVSGRPFYLGGIRIPYPKGPQGHSDGDALLHAITDAILGALAAGDIGEWFSDKDRRYKNVRSGKLLAAVLEKAEADGWGVHHLDTVITLERPKLGAYKLKMRRAIAKLIGTALDRVSIKAKTHEGMGPEGEGLAVSCEAVVTMKRNQS